ncbi:hypothetical protein [Steroidobacter agaridevorans]|uniref:hypothetical protein n=1 Tax=Steroidobacter agaridevorans TaxID=2695856 RepID=UPI0013797A62|nr:hypothetical protein [Steroidobacter agaridevorans]
MRNKAGVVCLGMFVSAFSPKDNFSNRHRMCPPDGGQHPNRTLAFSPDGELIGTFQAHQ